MIQQKIKKCIPKNLCNNIDEYISNYTELSDFRCEKLTTCEPGTIVVHTT